MKNYLACVQAGIWRNYYRLRAKLACTKGQGTTEYAILVGVTIMI